MGNRGESIGFENIMEKILVSKPMNANFNHVNVFLKVEIRDRKIETVDIIIRLFRWSFFFHGLHSIRGYIFVKMPRSTAGASDLLIVLKSTNSLHGLSNNCAVPLERLPPTASCPFLSQHKSQQVLNLTSRFSNSSFRGDKIAMEVPGRH